MQKILRAYLILLGVYLFIDVSIHLFDIKLLDVGGQWPQSALTYSRFISHLYASFAFLASVAVYELQRDLKKYKNLILITAVWALFHGILLIYSSITTNFASDFKGMSSLHVWLPFYNQYVLIEGIVLIIYSGIVYLWARSKAGE